MSSLASVLIVLTGSLGDLTRGLSVACAIKASHSDVKITWLVDSTWASLIQEHPALDELLIFDRKNPVRGAISLKRELASRHFSVTLDLQRHLKSGLFSFFSGAQRRIGFHRHNSKEGNFLLNTESIPPQDDTEPKLNHYLAFLDVLGIARPEVIDFGFATVAIDAWNEPMAIDSIGIVLSSSWQTKDWPIESYNDLLMKLLQETEASFVLLGGPGDREKGQQLSATLNNPRIRNLAGETSLLQLLDVIRKCVLCLGPDSGPGHLAAAVETPYVSLFGPTPPERVAPFGNDHLVVRSYVPCSPCSRKKCPGLGTICMHSISPDRVKEVLLGEFKQQSEPI